MVRRAIFTFENIPERINERDVPTISRDVPREDLVTALTAALAAGDALEVAATFLLENHSNRMADALRDEISERGQVSAKDGEIAMTEIINNIRALETNGEIKFILPEEE